MQTDENHLHLEYARRPRRLGRFGVKSSVPAGQQAVRSYIPIGNEIARRMAAKMRGIPKSMWSEVLLGAPTTAHILGGCNMADSPDRGVIGFNGCSAAMMWKRDWSEEVQAEPRSVP